VAKKKIIMEISLKANYGYELIFKADNVNVCEDIEERVYPKTAEGKPDFKQPPNRDISTDAMDTIANLFGDMAYYRKADYDSSSLIETLFEKLSETCRADLLERLNNSYEIVE
jgi:hypothetical protein